MNNHNNNKASRWLLLSSAPLYPKSSSTSSSSSSSSSFSFLSSSSFPLYIYHSYLLLIVIVPNLFTVVAAVSGCLSFLSFSSPPPPRISRCRRTTKTSTQADAGFQLRQQRRTRSTDGPLESYTINSNSSKAVSQLPSVEEEDQTTRVRLSGLFVTVETGSSRPIKRQSTAGGRTGAPRGNTVFNHPGGGVVRGRRRTGRNTAHSHSVDYSAGNVDDTTPSFWRHDSHVTIPSVYDRIFLFWPWAALPFGSFFGVFSWCPSPIFVDCAMSS